MSIDTTVHAEQDTLGLLTFDLAPSFVAVRGEIDLSTADQFAAALAEVDQPGTPTVIEMSGVTFVDSTALRTLVGLHRTLSDLVIQDPSNVVVRLLEVTSLDTVLTVARTAGNQSS